MQKTQKVLGILLLVAGVSSATAFASAVPEIPAASAGSAIALVSGIVLMFRARRSK